MRKLFLAGAALGLFALAAPASAMPVGESATYVAHVDDGLNQVGYRRHFRGYYRPRIILRYGYYGGGPYSSGSCLGRILYGIRGNCQVQSHRRLHPGLNRRVVQVGLKARSTTRTTRKVCRCRGFSDRR